MKRYHTHKPRLRLLKRLGSRIARLRYVRGHGVHSPYIYGIIREVFMRHNLITPQLGGVEQCRTMNHKTKMELQNLYTYCGYNSYSIDPLEGEIAEFVICSTEYPSNSLRSLYQSALKSGTTIVIESPSPNSERMRFCLDMVASHASTIVDKRRYMIIFNNHLPKQYFKL